MNTQPIQPLQWGELSILAPELTLVIAAVLITIIDLVLPRHISRSWIGGLSLASVLLSLGFVVWTLVERYSLAMAGGPVNAQELLGGSYRVDDFGLLIKVLLLLGTALVIWMSIGNLQEADIPHRGEYYYLLLPAALGGLILASSADLITLYVGLELLSITSYILVAMRKHDRRSTEGAFKYVVLGSVASAFLLYGMSFLYGITGTTHIGQIAQVLMQNASSFPSLMYLSFILMIVGLGFKIAAAPFHAWSPDVYQGAPTPVAAFLAVVSKGASLVLVFRLVFNVFFWSAAGNGLVIYQSVSLVLLSIAALSMIVGTTMALRQMNVKRLLALSGVANAGYLLVPIGLNILQPNAWYASGFSAFWYYLAAYLFTTMGAFAVLMIVSKYAGHDEMKGFAGLYHRAPWLAIAMTIFVLSLAGIPITSGFFGKLYILLGAVSTHELWIAIVMMVTSVISFYFYFGFIRQMYMRSPEERSLQVSVATGSLVVFSAVAVIVLGLFPNQLMEWVNTLLSVTSDIYIHS